MLVTPINQSYYGLAIEVIKATAHKGKSIGAEVMHRWSKVDLAIEPRLDRVLIGRRNVDQVACEQRANVIGHDLISDGIARSASITR